MKLLAIGDFHGKFPAKLWRLVKKEKIDLVVSVGDYKPFSLRKEFFKYSWRTDKELWVAIGKKKYKKYFLKDLKSAENVLDKLNKLDVPVFTISGNADSTKWGEATDGRIKWVGSDWKWPYQDFFSPMIKKFKNIKEFDYSYFRFGGIVFIGMARSTFPGHVKSKNYKKQRKVLEKLFKKFKKDVIIFVSHNVPSETKLDKIKDKNAPKEALGKHYGSKLVKRLVKKWKPLMNIAGHMHENQGRDKIGNSIIVNTGAAQNGQASIIEINDKTKRIKKIKFVK